MTTKEIVRRIFERAGMDALSCSGLGFVALKLLGEDALDYGDDSQRDAFILHQSPWMIYLRPDLTDGETTMAIALALAAWWEAVDRDGVSGTTREAVALELAGTGVRAVSRHRSVGPRRRRPRCGICVPAERVLEQTGAAFSSGKVT